MPSSNEYEWNDLSISYLGRVLVGIQGVKYKISSKDEFFYGKGKKPLGIQSGNESVEGEITILQSEFEALVTAVQTINPRYKITDIQTDIIWSFEKDNIVKTRVIKNIKFKEFEEKMEQGDMLQKITLSFLALDVEYS